MNQPQTIKAKSPTVQDELILVVKRSKLFGTHEAFQGLSSDSVASYLEIINAQHEFLPRSVMELDENYKQIIPYVVFKYQESYFLMQRKSSASEQRLKDKFTLGIGGHMRREDMRAGNSIFDWAKREFFEEVSYNGTFSIEPLGLINDDSNAVGKVHLGLALLVQGNVPEINVKSELKQGKLLPVQECLAFYDRLETWSQIIIKKLIEK